ncbi:MAG: hypothetical protein LC785_15190 [Acidobacteria bacterium]|nr:hypothetical protein [Acidobacteriota bacterium]
MDKKVGSVKCAGCGLVNFANAEVCKRCGKAFGKVEGESEPSNSELPQSAQTEAQVSHSPNLTPCPDCAHLCSRMAEACPNCGRFLQQIERPKKRMVGKVVSACVLVAVLACALLILAATRREAAVISAVQTGNAANAGVSSANRDAARAALNAVGEIQSVTSVGTNFMQYGSAIQSAKIKYDASMRDYKPRDAADDEIKRQLEEALYCYIDARDAWSAFVERGSEFGFIDEDDSVIKSLSTEYGFSSSSGRFYKGTVLKSIWSRASKSLNSVGERLQ